jgi:hypothetical protein
MWSSDGVRSSSGRNGRGDSDDGHAALLVASCVAFACKTREAELLGRRWGAGDELRLDASRRVCPESLDSTADFSPKFDEGGGLKNRRPAATKMSIG